MNKTERFETVRRESEEKQGEYLAHLHKRAYKIALRELIIRDLVDQGMELYQAGRLKDAV